MFAATYGNIQARPFKTYVRSITIDQPASDLTDFPLLFAGTYDFLRTTVNGGNVKSSSGYDIVFYSDYACTTKLSFQRVYWSATTGQVEFWIKIPTLTSATAKVIYLKYGDVNITTDQQDAANTWDSNYLSVWHFEDGTTLSLTDSKGSANGTNSGLQATTGQIDGGVFCDGSSNADFGNNDDFTTGNMTISLWHKSGTASGQILNKQNVAGGGAGWLVYNNTPSIGRRSPWFYIQTDNSNWKQCGFDIDHGDNTWRYFTFTRSGTTLIAFVNGSSAGYLTQSAGTVGTLTNAISLKIGSDNAGANKYTGYADEIHISASIRSDDWILTEYNNQSDPSSFYTLSFELDIDPDAGAFIMAAGITSGTQQGAIINLVKAAKANGWWTKCNAIYPFVGGTATSHKYNLKDPRDLDAAYRITWTGTITHSLQGIVTAGTSQGNYGNTHLTPNGTLTNFDTHISYYSRTNNTSQTVEIGSIPNVGSDPRMSFHMRYIDGNFYGDMNASTGGTNVVVAVSDSRGWFLLTRRTQTDLEAYRNGSSIGTNTTTEGDILASDPIGLLEAPTLGTLNSSSKQCAFATIGSGISGALAATMYTDIQNFQTSLGRQV